MKFQITRDCLLRAVEPALLCVRRPKEPSIGLTQQGNRLFVLGAGKHISSISSAAVRGIARDASLIVKANDLSRALRAFRRDDQLSVEREGADLIIAIGDEHISLPCAAGTIPLPEFPEPSVGRTFPTSDLLTVCQLEPWLSHEKYGGYRRWLKLRVWADGFRAYAGDGGTFYRLQRGGRDDAESTMHALLHRDCLVPLRKILAIVKSSHVRIRVSDFRPDHVVISADGVVVLLHSPELAPSWLEDHTFDRKCFSDALWSCDLLPEDWVLPWRGITQIYKTNEELNQHTRVTLRMDPSQGVLIASAESGKSRALRKLPVSGFLGSAAPATEQAEPTFCIHGPALSEILGECGTQPARLERTKHLLRIVVGDDGDGLSRVLVTVEGKPKKQEVEARSKRVDSTSRV